VHERLDVVAVGLHPGAVLVGEGPGGELLGRTSAAFGVARLSVDRLLAPAQEHRFSTLSMSLGQSAAPALGVGASEGEGDPLLLHTTEVSAEPRFAPHSVRRILYRETFWFPLGARILGVARLGQQLAVLTEHELRLSRISNGRWPGPRARWQCSRASSPAGHPSPPRISVSSPGNRRRGRTTDGSSSTGQARRSPSDAVQTGPPHSSNSQRWPPRCALIRASSCYMIASRP